MATALLTKKVIPNQNPGYFNYSEYGKVIKHSGYPLVRLRSNDLTKVEEMTFSDIITVEFSKRSEKIEPVKGDLPLSYEYGNYESNFDPRWLLFHRNALKRLAYA